MGLAAVLVWFLLPCTHDALTSRPGVNRAGEPSIVGAVEGIAQGRGGDCLKVFKESHGLDRPAVVATGEHKQVLARGVHVLAGQLSFREEEPGLEADERIGRRSIDHLLQQGPRLRKRRIAIPGEEPKRRRSGCAQLHESTEEETVRRCGVGRRNRLRCRRAVALDASLGHVDSGQAVQRRARHLIEPPESARQEPQEEQSREPPLQRLRPLRDPPEHTACIGR